MEISLKSERYITCECHKFPIFLHKLNQSLLIIQAYSEGCKKRLEINNMANPQLKHAVTMISAQIDSIALLVNEQAVS